MSIDTATATDEAPEATRGDDSARKYVSPSQAFGWDKGNLVIRSEYVLDNYNTDYLSPSTSKAMDGCPARWAAEKAAPRPENPFGAAELGTSAHTVMEQLFDLPGSQRTQEKAMNILLALSKEEWPGKDEATMAQRGKWIAEVYTAYKGLFDIEDPTTVVVKQTEMRAEGVEIVGVPFKGFIDRVDHSPDGLKVVDYKSGKIPGNIGKFGDDHGDQIRLYAEVIRVIEGHMPAEGLLYYTRHSKSRTVPINKTKMNEVLKKFRKSWVDLNAYVDRASFPTKTSALCGWCPLVNSCPAAQADGKTDRLGGAPSKIDLGIPVLKTFDAEELTTEARKKANTKAPSWDLDFGGASDEPPIADDPESSAPSGEALVDPLDASLSATAGSAEEDFSVPSALVEATPGTDLESPAVEPETGSPEPSAAHLTSEVPTDQKDTVMSNDLLAEGKPWEETVNGALNPASYAATAVFGTASLAYEEIRKAGVTPTKSTIDALSTTFAHMVDVAQQKLTGVTSFQDSANTRLRGALRTYLDAEPLPFGKGQAEWDTWVATGAKHITAIASAAVRLYEADLSGQPWTALAIRAEKDDFDATA